jgi:hypothetical protein
LNLSVLVNLRRPIFVSQHLLQYFLGVGGVRREPEISLQVVDRF